MHKLPGGLYVMEVVILPEEVKEVRMMVLASGKTESGFVRDMIGLEEKKRGRPLGSKDRRRRKKRAAGSESKAMFS